MFRSSRPWKKGTRKISRGVVTMFLAGALLFPACSGGPVSDPRVDEVLDRLAVQDTVDGLFRAVDLKDWERAKNFFADRVSLDIASLPWGGKGRMAPQAIVDRWEGSLAPERWTHHRTGSFVFTLAEYGANVSCYASVAWYRADRAEKLAAVEGTFGFHLVRTEKGWRIDSMRFEGRFEE